MSEQQDPSEPKPTVVSFVVERGNRRLDKVIRDRVPGLSRTQGQRLIEAERVTVEGHPCKPAHRVAVGDQVTVALPPNGPAAHNSSRAIRPESIPLDIIYEDEQVLVLNKPAGMVVHPGPGHPNGTLVNALLAHHPPIAQVGPRDRAGIVHRLDKETSGVLVVAKEETTLKALQEQFKSREIEKTYLALVWDCVQPPEGIIEVPIGRHPRHRQRMAALAEGKYARTRYHAVRCFHKHTLLELHPYTGRTHQIRVHLSWLGYPVVGDTTYGRRDRRLLKDRHFLHAHRLRFVHPTTGEELACEAPLPADLEDVLDHLRPSAPGRHAPHSVSRH
jgi:23S rRNA pseudouridine1911/1915/1917 synthase